MKNYNIYVKRISRFAGACGVKIKPLPNSPYRSSKAGRASSTMTQNCGECDAHLRIIYVSKSLPKSSKVAILLHEMGHLYDTFHNPDSVALSSAYKKYMNGTPITSKDKKLIFECEKSAWNQGRSIAQLLKIPLGKWFNDENEFGLRYYKSLKVRD